MLVRSRFSPVVCPRDEQRGRAKKTRGHPMVCRACDAGLVGGKMYVAMCCYTMCCTVCGGTYIGETQQPVHERFQEHYREAKALVVRTP